jgi:hypothetical protein
VPQRNPTRIDLKPAQESALAWLRENGSSELTRGLYETVTGMSRSQAAYDIAELVEAGILARVGGGRSTRYQLVDQPALKPAQRRWTSDRIRDELERFCSNRTAWPTAREFKRAGRTDLYVAASRYGGVRYWADQLGLTRGSSGPVLTPLARIRRWSWAGSGALAGAFVAGAVVAIVHPWSSAPKAVRTSRVTIVQHRAAAPTHATKAAAPRRQAKAKRVVRTRPSARASAPRTVRTAPAAQAQTVRAVASTASGSAPAASTHFVHRAPATDASTGSPTPLVAPLASSSKPAPLPAP